MLLSMGNSNPCLSYTQFFTVLSCPQLNKGTENTKETAQNSSSLLCIFPVLVEHHDLIHAEDGTGSGDLSSEVCAQLRRLSVVQDGAGQGHAQRVVPPCKQGDGVGATQGLPAAPPAPRGLQLQERGQKNATSASQILIRGFLVIKARRAVPVALCLCPGAGYEQICGDKRPVSVSSPGCQPPPSPSPLSSFCSSSRACSACFSASSPMRCFSSFFSSFSSLHFFFSAFPEAHKNPRPPPSRQRRAPRAGTPNPCPAPALLSCFQRCQSTFLSTTCGDRSRFGAVFGLPGSPHGSPPPPRGSPQRRTPLTSRGRLASPPSAILCALPGPAVIGRCPPRVGGAERSASQWPGKGAGLEGGLNRLRGLAS